MGELKDRLRADLTAATKARDDVTKATLRMAMAAMADPQSKASDVARRLGMTTTTLYAYVNGDGSLKPSGQAFLNKAE